MTDNELTVEELNLEEEVIIPQTEGETPDPLAQSVYEHFLEKGYFEEDPDKPFDGSFEYIDNQLSELPQKLLTSAIQELPQESQHLLKFVAAAGANLTRDELRNYFDAHLKETEEVKLETQDEARSFLEAELKAKGLRASAIQAQLDELEEEGQLMAEAEKIKKEKPKLTDKLLSDKQKALADKAERERIFVSNIQKELLETKWAQARQDKITKTIPKANDILSKIVADPKAYIQFIDILTRFDGKQFDFEDLKKQGESKAASDLKEKIQRNGFSSAASSSGTQTQIVDLLKNYEIVA